MKMRAFTNTWSSIWKTLIFSDFASIPLCLKDEFIPVFAYGKMF